MLRLTLLALMVAASAAAAPAAALGKLNALRGHHHTHKHHTHKHGDMRFQKTKAKTVAKAGSEGGSKPVHIIPASLAKTDNVAREGLGENLPYKGIDYLGTGYDLLTGNPEGNQATKIDDGFRRPVIELEWSQDAEHNSRDLRDLQPMHGWAMPAKSCNQASSSQTISSSSDYESSLSAQASVEAGVDTGFASGSFKASAGMNSFKKDVLDSDSYRFEMISYCIQWKAGLNRPTNLTSPGYKPVSEFVERARELPKITDHDGSRCAGTMIPAPHPPSSGSEVQSMDGTTRAAAPSLSGAEAEAEAETAHDMVCDDSEAYKKWERFFKDFGTHFIHYVEGGGKMIFQIDVTSASMTSTNRGAVDLALEIEGEYGPVSGAASVAVQSESSSTNSNSNTKKKVKTIVLGGTPPGDPKTGFGEWAASVPDDPMPVKYKFLPLYYAGSEHIDRETYNVMSMKYKTTVINGNVRPDTTIKDRKPAWIAPGESMVSTGDGQYVDSERNVLKLESDGRMTITSRQGTVLWDSMFTEVPKMSTRPSPGAYELKLLTNGNLVLQRLEALLAGEEPFVIWQAITSVNSCQSRIADKVEFKKGQLTVKSGSDVLWSSKTHNSAGQMVKAKPKYFGYGENNCVKECVTLYKDDNYKGDKMKLKPFPVGSGFYAFIIKNAEGVNTYNDALDAENWDHKISSMKTGMPYYKSTDSPLSRAGVDGAECILHVWENSVLWQKDSYSKMTGLPMAAGAGTANKYGNQAYDFYVRDAKYRSHYTRGAVSISPYIGNDKMRSAVVQLATDVQRWRCMDDIRSTTVAGKTTYLPCKAWEGDDSIAASFVEFNNRMNEYFSIGCGCAMKMAQCPDAVR